MHCIKLFFCQSRSDGFCRVLCQSGSCVGVAGNLLKLYTFIHQMGDAVK